MEDRKLDAAESLALIGRMIENTRSRMVRNAGRPFLAWGYATAATLIAVWAAVSCTGDVRWNYLWFMLPLLGGALMYFTRPKATEGSVHTYVDRVLDLIWSVIGPATLLISTLAICFVVRFPVAFTVLLMILVGAVFVSGPAELLAGMTPDSMNVYFWVTVIFIYYVLATMLPVDKIIGRVYPLFAFALLFMAVGILVMLYVKSPDLPEMWNGFGTKYEKNPIFPMMFISIACGAISGFHATQSPLMARCITNEKHCRPIFYGAMVTEGVVALIWAAAATYFFHENGTVDEATGIAYSGARVATDISKDWLGTFGGILAILGIVAAPITSGDTALRSARLIVADFLHIGQKKIRPRLIISLPIFLLTIALLVWSFGDAEGFKVIWRYFAWCNQTLSVFTLWALTVWLVREHKNYFVTLIPALFMTCVCSTYIFIAPEGLALSPMVAYPAGAACVLIAIVWFVAWFKKR